MSTVLPRFLLIEPQFVLRRTIAMVAREQGVVDFQEASNVGPHALLAGEAFEGVVIDLHEGPLAMALLGELRQGWPCHPRRCPGDCAGDRRQPCGRRASAGPGRGRCAGHRCASVICSARLWMRMRTTRPPGASSLLSTRWPGGCRDACLCSCLYVLGGHILPAQGGILLQY